MAAIRYLAIGGAALAATAGTAIAQLSFRPATELGAIDPPSTTIPLNAAQVILGMADQYVYARTVDGNERIRVSSDFVESTLLELPSGATSSVLVGVSEDGRRVLAAAGYAAPGSGSRAVLWQDGGAPQVCAIGGTNTQSVTQADAACEQWVVTLGLQGPAYLASAGSHQQVGPFDNEDVVAVLARAISADGRVVAGQVNAGVWMPFVWTEAQGARLLEPQPSGSQNPVMVSNDGNTVVCGLATGPGFFGVLASGVYTRRGLTLSLPLYFTYLAPDTGTLLGCTNSEAVRAVWWTESLGTEDIATALGARGIDLHGWTLREARYISADGRTLVGRGSAPHDSAIRWWVAQIDPLAAADIGKAGGRDGSDGRLDNNDFIVFISRFFAQDPRADVGRAEGERGGDGVFDNNDFIAFISLFFTGEP